VLDFGESEQRELGVFMRSPRCDAISTTARINRRSSSRLSRLDKASLPELTTSFVDVCPSVLVFLTKRSIMLADIARKIRRDK